MKWTNLPVVEAEMHPYLEDPSLVSGHLLLSRKPGQADYMRFSGVKASTGGGGRFLLESPTTGDTIEFHMVEDGVVNLNASSDQKHSPIIHLS